MPQEEKLKKKLEDIEEISKEDPLRAGHAYLILAQGVSVDKDDDLKYVDLATKEAKKLLDKKELSKAGELFQSIGMYLRSKAKYKK